MKTLLIHPEDSPLLGPWASQDWDLIVDLGRSSTFTASQWSEHAHCPVLRLDSFRIAIEDVRAVKQIFSAGHGFLVDRQGLDWWDIVSLYFVAQAETVFALQRVCRDLDPSHELWATRTGSSSAALASLLGRSVNTFPQSFVRRLAASASHYTGIARRFSSAQMQEILLDKYDAGYRHRSRIRRRPTPLPSPVVLIPSAYENVSRMAAAYARLVPHQKFLMVCTRRSATLFDQPENLAIRHLSNYAPPDLPAESASLLQAWQGLQTRLMTFSEYRALRDAGVFSGLKRWLADGLSVRDAWMSVLAAEPVCSVLCGDDSNSYTRIPMLLAHQHGLPTLDFHHGALDGFYLVKELECTLYLAKSEMERDYLIRACRLPPQKIALAAPAGQNAVSPPDRRQADAIVLFSEPYENSGARGRDVYAELLPQLARLARQRSGRVIVKLHPFESAAARRALVQSIVPPEDLHLFTVIDGPLTPWLFEQAWCGLTVESTTVMDCALNQVPCFLCEWLATSSFGYVQQFTRFGLGTILKSAADIEAIPATLATLQSVDPKQRLWSPANRSELARWLAGNVTTEGSPTGTTW